MRRIKHAEVKRLALCKRGKNGLKTLYKSDGTAEFATLTKGDLEKGELLTVMWAKGLADEDGDFSDTEAAIDSMTSSLIRNGGAMDIEHDGDVLPKEAVEITEIFTVQKSDERFADWQDYEGNVVDVTGGAAVKIQLKDPKLRAAYRNGDWDGVSLFGPAAVEEIDTKAASQRVAARMGGVQEIEMTKEELQAALDAQETKIMALFKSALSEVKTVKSEGDNADPEAQKPEAKPTFTGNVNDEQALADYEGSLRGYEMRKAIAEGNMSADDIAEMRKSMSESGPSVDELVEAGIPAEEGDSKKVRQLQIELFKAKKGSNTPERKGTGLSREEELSKACEDEGLALGKLLNENMGAASSTSMRIVG